MVFNKFAMRIFYPMTENALPYFTNLKSDLKRADVKLTVQEFLSNGIMISFLVFTFELPALSFIFGILLKSFLFGFISSFTFSLFITVLFFIFYVNAPKFTIRSKAKKIDDSLPFATTHLATISSSKLPFNKVIEIFSKLGFYGELGKEISRLVNDMKYMGLDVNTALEREIDRTPSKNFKELMYGILSTNRSGGDMSVYLNEKAKSFLAEYRRRLYEFSHQLSLFIEIYLTAIVLGAVFFVILTSIISGIGGIGGNVVLLQFFLIFIFLPLISAVFIYLIKSSTPGGE